MGRTLPAVAGDSSDLVHKPEFAAEEKKVGDTRRHFTATIEPVRAPGG